MTSPNSPATEDRDPRCVRPFDPEVVAATPYDIWHFQNPLFVIDSFDHLSEAFERWVCRRVGPVQHVA